MHTAKTKFLSTAAFVAFNLSSFGQTAPNVGARTIASINDVNSGGGENNPGTVIRGGEHAPFAFSDVNDLRGIAEASATLQINLNEPPILRGRAVLSGGHTMLPDVVGAHAFTESFASDLFQYTGATAGTLQLTFSLEGLVSDLPADSQTFIKSRVAVFNIPNYEFTSSFDTLAFELGAVPKAYDLTTLQILNDTGGTLASRTTTLSFNVNPGEIFYVWETLDTSARRDTRSADAFNTLTSEFDHPELVVSASNVPEPGSLMLLVCGFAALMGTSRSLPETKAA